VKQVITGGHVPITTEASGCFSEFCDVTQKIEPSVQPNEIVLLI
jgi:hypothetical protein